MENSPPMRVPDNLPAGAPPQLYRFGLFEADPRSGELRKSGVKLRVQEQPFQILLVLLERPDEVITREELRQRLWSNDTFVDFDHGLNTAINKLRDALGDTAGNPRFIETLARRGYRFIAPVQRVEWPDDRVPRERASDTAPEVLPNQAGPEGGPAGATTAKDAGSAASDGGATTAPPAAAQASPGPVAVGARGLEEELPRPHRGLTRALFALVQVLHLVFYVIALWRLDYIHALVDEWRSGYGLVVMIVVVVSAPVGIAVKLYLLSAVAFDYQKLGLKFRRLYPVILPLDQLWALSPFLLLPQIGIGAAFAACAALLYLPFSERTLIRMSYRYERGP